jgi:hypothetical protein
MRCEDVTRSSFVNRICYDSRASYLVLQLRDRYYHYCRVPAAVAADLAAASSVGSYYNAAIRGRYDCRGGGIPGY